MTLADLIGSVVSLILGNATTDGLLGADFGVFVAAAVVSGLAVMQVPRLFKRLR